MLLVCIDKHNDCVILNLRNKKRQTKKEIEMKLEIHSGIFNILANPSNTDIEIVKNTIKKMQEYDETIVAGSEGEDDEYYITCSYDNSTQAEIKELYKDCK